MHLAGWVVDFDDPMDLVSFMGNPNIFVPPQYQGEDLVQLYQLAKGTFNQQKRLHLFDRIQRLIQEDAIQVPLYEGSLGYLFHPALKGFVWHPSRSVADFRHVWIDEQALGEN